MTERRHECACVLAKGTPRKPLEPLPDVIRWRYTANRHHPTEKPISALAPIIRAFTKPGEVVLDPFAGSPRATPAPRTRASRTPERSNHHTLTTPMNQDHLARLDAIERELCELDRD